MAPKKNKYKPSKISERFRCDRVEGEQFHAPAEEVFRYNWWEVFCFPYILCARFWDCFISLCSGTNQCLVYWMMIQWLVCKITRLTTPDPIIFPYYFYLFCQVILLTAFFILLWNWIAKRLLTEYFKSFYSALTDDLSAVITPSPTNASRLSFRRYCFRKGDIFDSSIENSAVSYINNPTSVVAVIVDLFLADILN